MSSAVPITIVIPTRNECHQIAACVNQSLWADEVLVADGGSTDGTIEVARTAGAKVLEGTGPGIGRQRNQAFARARNEWIFSLDADERFTPELIAEITGVVRAPQHAAYRVRRRNFWLGYEQTRGSWSRDWVVRLHRREHRYTETWLHEHLEPVGDTGSLRAALIHYPYRDLSHQLDKMSRYAELGARDLWNAGRRARGRDLVVRPAWRFVKAYVFGGGILEGRAGLVRSVLGAYTGFLKYAALWSLERTPRD